MNFKLLLLFLIVMIETFVELMIKAMDMELLDWKEIDSWKATKLGIMAFILIYLAFKRWIPFVAIGKFKKGNSENHFSTTLQLNKMPWFFFSNLFQIFVMGLFSFISWKLNPNAYYFYGLLFLGSIEMIIYLFIGNQFKFFGIEMGKNLIIISRGELAIIHLKDTQRIERKYNDEIYIISKKGEVNTINSSILPPDKMNDFLNRLKENCENHNVYFANDLV